MTSSAFEDTRTAKVDGTTLAFREQGEGEPVVFVHGAIIYRRTWEQQLPAIGIAEFILETQADGAAAKIPAFGLSLHTGNAQ